MDLGLKDKVIFVTGGFKGIGRAIALQVAREGAIPVVLNRKNDQYEPFKKELEEITDKYEIYFIDLNNTEEIEAIVKDVVKKYGHIDGVVNNAGRNDNLAIEETSWQDFEKSIHSNLTSRIKEKQRINSKHFIQDSSYWTRENICICSSKRSYPWTYKRMGSSFY